jgi:hypothetical protein
MAVESHALKAATKTVLNDIAKHANTLATGLQNAAPPMGGGPNKSVLYLTEIAKELTDMSRSMDEAPHEED